MAASLFPSQKGEEFKEQFLTCSLCYESYDNGEHQAKCLPCLHTYCLSCLKSHAGKKTTFNCPQCRKEITLPGDTVDSLPNNFLVENLKQYEDILNLAVSCGNCDDKNRAVSFCHDCGCFLCNECIGYHQKVRALQHHKLSTMQELQEQNYRPRKEQVCQKHPSQSLNLFCKDAECKVPVCASCGLVDHRSHELVDLTTAIDEIISEIKQFSASVNGTTQELVKLRETVETDQDKVTRNSEQIIQDINVLEKNVIKMIKSKCSQATSRVKQLCETEMKSLTSEIESIDNLMVQMTSACEFANNACDMNQPTELLTSQLQIIYRLRELKNAELPNTTSNMTEFTFTDNHQSALTQIQQSVQHLCDIAWIRDTGIHETESNMSTVEREPIDPEQCTIRLRLRGNDFNWRQAIIQAVNTDGQLMTTGGDNVAVSQYGFSQWRIYGAHDLRDGTYSLEYDSYMGGQLHVKINGTRMIDSPFDPKR